MKKEKNKFVFANGDSMNPVFAIDGAKLFDSESVERKIEELEDEIRVTKGNANIAYALNSFYERDIKKQKYKRCLAMAEWCESTALWCYQAANTLPIGFHATLYGKPVMIEPARLFKRFALLSKWNKRWLSYAEKIKKG